MPKEKRIKAKSTPKLTFVQKILGIVVVFILLMIVSYVLNIEKTQNQIDFGTIDLKTVEVASDDASRARGLGGRSSLASDTAMLFTFDESSLDRCFWMKDMNFAIDMIWLDESKKVVDIKENVSPDTYPKNFCPTKPAQYVLEVQAGLSNAAGVDVGSQL